MTSETEDPAWHIARPPTPGRAAIIDVQGRLERSRLVGPSSPRSNLQDASRPDRKDEDRAQHHGEKEGDRKRYLLVRTIEVDLDSLEVQKDEDQQ